MALITLPQNQQVCDFTKSFRYQAAQNERIAIGHSCIGFVTNNRPSNSTNPTNRRASLKLDRKGKVEK
jgi:hypothetical protein